MSSCSKRSFRLTVARTVDSSNSLVLAGESQFQCYARKGWSNRQEEFSTNESVVLDDSRIAARMDVGTHPSGEVARQIVVLKVTSTYGQESG